MAAKHTTILSTKGQVILPKAVRQQRRWGPGTQLTVEDVADGVLLRVVAAAAPTQVKDVFGALKYSGRPKSLKEIKAGIAAEARRRHARNRY